MDSKKKNLLLVSFTPLDNEPRPAKQILLLRERYNIFELAYSPSPYADHFYRIDTPKKGSIQQKLQWFFGILRGNLHAYVKRYTTLGHPELEATPFDLVFAHNVYTCPLAFQYAKGCPVIVDLHEYLPEERSENLRWRLIFQRGIVNLCHEYLPQAAATLTTSEELATLYRKNFGISPTVNFNAPPFEHLSPSPVDKIIHIVHHGVASPSRNLIELIELMDTIHERYHLHLYLVGSGDYYEAVRQRALAHPRVHWHNPVPLKEISTTINQYDIGIHLLAPCNLNHDLTIGNKFFEYIQARLAVAVWPTTSMSRLLKQYPVGFVTPEPTVKSMAAALNALTTEEIIAFKQQSDSVAPLFTAEESIRQIDCAVRQALGNCRSTPGSSSSLSC